LERVEHLVQRRICIGEMFNEAVKGCSWMVPQAKISDANHTYYTYGVLYEGESARGIPWREFYKKYKERGGDGFYATWVNPYLEPVLKGKNIDGIVMGVGLCPVAEQYQKKIMLFKTNYRDLGEAAKNVDLLASLIDEIGR
jgi:perosamine synthetase